MKRELLGGVLAVGLLAGCSNGPEAVAPDTTPPMNTEATVTADGLPIAVQTAARALMSIEAPDVVNVIRNADGSVAQTTRSGYSYGSGVHIGNGNVLTANHVGVGSGANTQGVQEYSCFGHQAVGTSEDSYFFSNVDSTASNTQKFNDIALLQSDPLRSQNYPFVKVTDTIDGNEQKVYLVNYQSLDRNEKLASVLRSPAAKDEEMRTPAIFSGLAKLSLRGDWIIITGKGITKDYGSGNPQRLTGGGSGGALLNSEGTLIGVTTAISDSIKPTLQEIERLTDTHFKAPPARGEGFWLQYGVKVDTRTVQALGQTLHMCQPDSNDTITTR